MSNSQFTTKTKDHAKRIADGLRAAGNIEAAHAYLNGYHRRNQIEWSAANEGKSYDEPK